MDMDINTIRGLATLFALIAFVAMIAWTYSSRRKKDFDEAASLPFAEHDLDAHRRSDNRFDSSSEHRAEQKAKQKAEMISSQTEESKNNE